MAQGLRVHADPHDVFALQTHGRKQWVLYEGDQQPAADGSGGIPSLDAQLTPGDCLYVPKGTHHAARTVDSPSIHLTLGVRTLTWADVLRTVVDGAAGDPSLGEPLPPGFAHHPRALAEEGARRLESLASAVRGADAAAALDGAASRFWNGRVPALGGQLQQLLAAGEVNDETLVRRRPHSACDLETADGALVVTLGDRALRMPAAAEPAMAEVVRHETLRPRNLAEHLDETGRVALVRRLVQEGLLMITDG